MIYSQTDLLERVNAGVQGKLGILVSSENTVNAGVRKFYSNVDLRSAKRKSTLVPNLFNDIFPYAAPSDIKGQSLIDIPQQAKRQDGEWTLTTEEEFDRDPKAGLMALCTNNGINVLKLASAVDSQSILISELDNLNSGGGVWSAFGDATALEADDADFIKGAGSLKFNISAAGGTTAGIVNSTLTPFSIVDYLDGTSAFFVWFKINSITNLTNMILRFGSSSGNYYSKTVTAQADGTAFVAGWNLLRFDVASLTTTGTPNTVAINYSAIYMTKTAGKISESDYKLDWLILKKGVVTNIRYYSKYGWQSSTGTYKENSTIGEDLLVADTDEFDMLVDQCTIGAMEEIGFPFDEITQKKNDLKTSVKEYLQRNPSEAKIIMYDSYNFIKTS